MHHLWLHEHDLDKCRCMSLLCGRHTWAHLPFGPVGHENPSLCSDFSAQVCLLLSAVLLGGLSWEASWAEPQLPAHPSLPWPLSTHTERVQGLTPDFRRAAAWQRLAEAAVSLSCGPTNSCQRSNHSLGAGVGVEDKKGRKITKVGRGERV